MPTPRHRATRDVDRARVSRRPSRARRGRRLGIGRVNFSLARARGDGRERERERGMRGRSARARNARARAVFGALACLFARARAEGVVVAIGDVHGDARALARALALAGTTDGGAEGRWWRDASAGDDGATTTVIQTGDAVDRGDRSIDCHDALERLKREANASGDEVVTLMGNHELMTLQGDLRFVGGRELMDLGVRALREGGTTGDEDGSGASPRAYAHAGRLAWMRAFARGSARGDEVRSKPVAVTRGEGRCATVFVHAGLTSRHLFGANSVDALNARARQVFDVDVVSKSGEDDVTGGDGPLWTREISMGDEELVCKEVEETLARLNVKRMVVGHTPTKSGSIETRCEGMVHMIDVGMSSAYGGVPSVWMCTESEGPMAITNAGERVALE